jgi:hypothetical protein
MMANKQLLLKSAFKVFNGNRDRRLGNMELPGGFSDTLGLYNGDEVFKLFERESRHSLTLYGILSQAETV